MVNYKFHRCMHLRYKLYMYTGTYSTKDVNLSTLIVQHYYSKWWYCIGDI